MLLLITACNQSQEEKSKTQQNSLSIKSDTTNLTHSTSSYTFNGHGYIGNNTINIELYFDNHTVTGYYMYEKNKQKITLKGTETEWYGGPIYTIEEFDITGKQIGTWHQFQDLIDFQAY